MPAAPPVIHTPPSAGSPPGAPTSVFLPPASASAVVSIALTTPGGNGVVVPITAPTAEANSYCTGGNFAATKPNPGRWYALLFDGTYWGVYTYVNGIMDSVELFNGVIAGPEFCDFGNSGYGVVVTRASIAAPPVIFAP